jgi:hypothetical protein
MKSIGRRISGLDDRFALTWESFPTPPTLAWPARPI